jgi:hypothetical protein
MKRAQVPALAGLAIALMSLAGASTASATALEVKQAAKNEPVTISASLASSSTLESTSGVISNTCSTSTVGGTTSVFSGTTVSGPVSTLSFGGCLHEKVVVSKMGSLSVERIGATTNGTVRSSGAEVTVPVTIFGSVVTTTCTTSETDLGTLAGVASGNATITLSAILDCGGVLPSAKWTGTYTVTSPEGLGVTT